jgi:hypothetical protein
MKKSTSEVSTVLVPVIPVVTKVAIGHCVYCIREAALVSSPPQNFVRPHITSPDSR